MSRALRIVAACGTLACALPLAAQCANVAVSSGSVPGADNIVYASAMWDPDGAGPAAPRLVVGGLFTVVGSVAAKIAAWDPTTSTWSALGTGFVGEVFALLPLPNGDLVAGGIFGSIGGVAAGGIARWNGTTWVPMGSGVAGWVTSLARMQSGDVIAGGTFLQAGGVAANNIARWNGTAWSPLGTGLSDVVDSLAVAANGDLIAGGQFQLAGGVTANKVARWNGSSWSSLGAGLSTASGVSVKALAVMTNGEIVAGGDFTTGPSPRIARWNGSAWLPLGTGLDGTVRALAATTAGSLYVGGGFANAGGIQAAGVARWNGASWTSIGSLGFTTTGDGAFALTVAANGHVFVGGEFFSVSGVAVSNLARWTGTTWGALGNGILGFVNAVLALPNGDVVAGGTFTTIGSTVVNHIARWNGTTWSPLGSGLDGPVAALTLRANGDIVAGGSFANAGAVAAANVARWNGTTWSPLGAGVQYTLYGGVAALATLPNGGILAGGIFSSSGGTTLNNVAWFGGLSWVPLGTGTDGPVSAVQVMPNGDYVIAGQFSTAGGVAAPNVARWNGAAWSGLGAGLGSSWTTSSVRSLHLRPNGELVAGGTFTVPGGGLLSHIASWNGTAWAQLGTGTDQEVLALATHANGDLFAAGAFDTAGGVPAEGLARWNGTSWAAVGSGVADDRVVALASLPNGQLAIGGDFLVALGTVSPYVARIATTCPALATSYGAGCTSSAGPMSLAATSLPWLGGTYRATTTGMPAISLGLDVFGLTQVAIALPSILPQGVAGCSLLASPDLLGTLLPAAGTAQTQLPIPNSPSLVNALLRHQVAALELDSTGITAITSSNGLTLTLGSF